MSWLTVIAILLAPFVAVHVQKRLEQGRETKERKLNVFRSLMATRGAILSPIHVEALNRIDISTGGLISSSLTR